MTDITRTEIKAHIIRKLVLWRKWGGSHTENIVGGFPTHLRGDKLTKTAIKELVQQEWLLPAKKTNEIHYSLNPRKSNEIPNFTSYIAKNNYFVSALSNSPLLTLKTSRLLSCDFL